MTNKEGKVALIAGFHNEAGRGAAEALTEAGWKVLAVDLVPRYNLKQGDLLAGYLSLDLTDREECRKAVRELEGEHGSIDFLFCATGFEEARKPAGFLETPIDQWEKTLDGWLKSTINMCSALAPAMAARQEGRVLILSPDYGKVTGDWILEASAAGTLHGFAKSFGVEMAPVNVLVNCLAPTMPLDPGKIGATIRFLADSGNYVSAQVISLHGEEEVQS
jgi:NAD(P)-dependent dehydrogenase (short-subunit alcohol dehydrogenase family)